MKLLLLHLTILFAAAPEPTKVSWQRLANVQFTRKLNKEVNMYFLYPTFGPSVNALKGKEISVKGYLIPLDPEQNLYVLSAQPMSMCFFCGGAGPESIMELHFKSRRQKFKTDEIRTVKGLLALNADNIEHLNYILKDAEVIP